jgi:hypothetical protein
MAVTEVNGTDLFYTTVGRGIPCLMMPGGLGVDREAIRTWLQTNPRGGS